MTMHRTPPGTRFLRHTRELKMSIYNWVDSFTAPASKKLGKKKRIEVNKIIAKQITDDEKLIITTIDPRYTTAFINAGDYFLNQVISTLLAQHTSRFSSRNTIPLNTCGSYRTCAFDLGHQAHFCLHFCYRHHQGKSRSGTCIRSKENENTT
jgi:hypothetical protein